MFEVVSETVAHKHCGSSSITMANLYWSDGQAMNLEIFIIVIVIISKNITASDAVIRCLDMQP